MNRSLALLALLSATMFAACGGTQTKNDAAMADKSATHETKAPAAQTPAAQTPAAQTPAAQTPATQAPATPAATEHAVATTESGQATEGEIVLTGTTGCGHCNFHKTESCAVGLQTADGHIYVIDGVGEDTEVWNQRFAGKKMMVKGTMAAAQKDGLDHVQMASYEWVEQP